MMHPRIPGLVLATTLLISLLLTISMAQETPSSATAVLEPTSQPPLASSTPAGPEPIVNQAVKHDLSPPLSEIAHKAPIQGEVTEIQQFALPRAGRVGPQAALRVAQDSVVQDWQGNSPMPAPIQNFDGLDSDDNLATIGFQLIPPDTQGDVGLRHYVQWVNLTFAIWDKAGNLLYGPAGGNTLWTGFGGACEHSNDGDPISLYDPLADRWLMAQFALPFFPDGPFYQCIAISASGDPTGAWYRYAFQWKNGSGQDVMNDYPKFGVWPDGYYMTANQFTAGSSEWAGTGVAAFERSKMLQGKLPRVIYFDLGPTDWGGMLPADLDGFEPPPAGSPNYFVEANADEWGVNLKDELQVYEFHVDWADPSGSRFTQIATLPLSPFDGNMCGGSQDCIPQPDTTQKIDALADRLMYRLQYRNTGSHETLVSNLTVDADGNDHAGIRWFELRKSSSSWSIHQQGTYAPDGDHRWMGSMAMDRVGNVALGYSISGSSTFPSIRYAGRLASDPLGTLPQAETELVAGASFQAGGNRWGDYSMMGLDPVDNCTFWYTQQYISTPGTWGNWSTRIGSFRFPDCLQPVRTPRAYFPLAGQNGSFLDQTGVLEGVVQSRASGTPIIGARVEAGTTGTYVTHSQAPDGRYRFEALPPRTYQVSAEAPGHRRITYENVVVRPGGITTRDIRLRSGSSHELAGTVTDATAGWPLYASVEIENYPLGRVWTDPATGSYSLILSGDVTGTLRMSVRADGYEPAHRDIAHLSEGQVEDFSLLVNAETCTAPGYERTSTGPDGPPATDGLPPADRSVSDSAGEGQNLDCQPLPGGLVVGNVYDDNTGVPLNGAVVAHQGGASTTTRATPLDPERDDGFYTIFSSGGSQQMTAAKDGGYETKKHTVRVRRGNTVHQDFGLAAGLLAHEPDRIDVTIELGSRTTVPLTLTNQGEVRLAFEITPIDMGFRPPGSKHTVDMMIPGTELNYGPNARVAKRHTSFRPDVHVVVHQAWRPSGEVKVLLLTPDQASGGDISLIQTTLQAFPDLKVSLWDASQGSPTGASLAPYDVVIVGNDYLWTAAGIEPQSVGNALADYIDAGGKVVDTLFAHDFRGWGLAGRYIDESYSVFGRATADLSAIPYSLGAVYDPGHPLLTGVRAIQDTPTLGTSHQAVPLAPGAIRLADWDSGEVYIAYSDSVVGINQVWYHGANWTGDVPTLMHNAILYLVGGAVDWLSVDPRSGEIAATDQQEVSISLDAGATSVAEPGEYMATLGLTNDTPYGSVSIPVTLTVLP